MNKSKKPYPEDVKVDELDLKLRDNIDIFDFSNRSCVIGIDTILLISNKRGNFFYFHKRAKKGLAEAMNTFHVVPAGTFQPRHTGDGWHKYEFSMYKNIMRELGEELLGKEEFEEMTTGMKDVLEVEEIEYYHCLKESGKGNVYFLGMGLDCLTTKPEFLTAMAFRDLESVDFKDNYEGEHFSVILDDESIDNCINNDKTLPAGAVCLWLVKRNMNFFLNQL